MLFVHLPFSTIREDGMVRCLDKSKKRNDSKLPDMGCYRQTTTYLLLAAELKKIGVVLPQFELLTEFYINYHVAFRPDDYEKVIIEEMTETFYPIDHVHIGLHMIMYALSVLGMANHPNCEKAWALLDSKKDSEGKYILSKSFDEPCFNVGKVGFILLLQEKRARGIISEETPCTFSILRPKISRISKYALEFPNSTITRIA